MADTKITALTALTAADPANDVIPIVDVSDTTMAASGTTKKISVNNILGCSGTATLASATITGALDAARLNVTAATIPANGVYLVTTNKIGFSTNSIQRLTIDATGNLANTTTTTQDGFLQFSNTIDGGTLGYFGNPRAFITGGATSSVGIRGESSVQFSIGLNLAMTLNSTGLNIANGNVILGTSGKGIDFSATANSSGTMTSELLNDYEEGTWTGTLKGSITDPTVPLTATGVYTKIGRVVTVTIRFAGSTVGASGAVSITGLPFVSSQETPGSVISSNALTFTGIPAADINASSSTIEFFQTTSSGALSTVTHSAGLSRSLLVSLTYIV